MAGPANDIAPTEKLLVPSNLVEGSERTLIMIGSKPSWRTIECLGPSFTCHESLALISAAYVTSRSRAWGRV